MKIDTIFALSSGALPSGVAVIRVSGSASGRILKDLTGDLPQPRRAVLREIKSVRTGEVLDEALILWFPGPNSFTGEDVVEIQGHGGRASVAAILSELAAFEGCRAAEAGEFTRRAFEAGRLDLTEVEGLADLIAAETEAQRKQALRQMSGALGELYNDWRTRLIRMRAFIEAELDFSDEDDVPDSVADEVWLEAAQLQEEIRAHLSFSKGAERLREGLQVVLLGAPNAGKSSLLNALARRDVAIVTEQAGTTRDVLEVHMDLGGYPLTIIDTAGIRETDGLVEREGIRRALDRAERADLVLWLHAPGSSEREEGETSVASMDSVPFLSDTAAVWSIASKSDLIEDEIEIAMPPQLAGFNRQFEKSLALSAATGAGVKELIDALTLFAEDNLAVGSDPVATRSRHRELLNHVIDYLGEATQIEDGFGAAPIELRSEALRSAADALGKITGRIDVEDLLDVIFRDFCIGK